jgi:hypothetical protein
MGRWSTWIASSKRLDDVDLFWLVGHSQGLDFKAELDSIHDPRRPDGSYHLPIEGGTHVEVRLQGRRWADRMPRPWITEMEQALSPSRRRARLRSFVSMDYYDREELGLPAATQEVLDRDTGAAWWEMIKLFNSASARWPVLLCQPDPSLTDLQIVKPEEATAGRRSTPPSARG